MPSNFTTCFTCPREELSPLYKYHPKQACSTSHPARGSWFFSASLGVSLGGFIYFDFLFFISSVSSVVTGLFSHVYFIGAPGSQWRGETVLAPGNASHPSSLGRTIQQAPGGPLRDHLKESISWMWVGQFVASGRLWGRGKAPLLVAGTGGIRRVPGETEPPSVPQPLALCLYLRGPSGCHPHCLTHSPSHWFTNCGLQLTFLFF